MKKDTSKSTILVISMGFLALFLLFHWQWAVVVSLIAGVVGIASSFLSRKIEWGWMKLGHIMGFIVSNMLLSLVFYLVLFPISLLNKLFSKDPVFFFKENQFLGA
jgi:hypothetical protein